MKYKNEILVCEKCDNKFIKKIIRYPIKCDDKRDSYYTCPYCNQVYPIHLMGDEDVITSIIKVGDV